MVRYLVVVDGAGDTERDFSVLVVKAESPRAAVERVTAPEMGYGRERDGVAYVAPLLSFTVFRVGDTTHKQVTPISFREVVEDTSPSLRPFLDVDGGHPRA